MREGDGVAHFSQRCFSTRYGSWKSVAATKDGGFEELNHSPCSPDLSPSDYFMLQKLHGCWFSSNDELKAVLSHSDLRIKTKTSIFAGAFSLPMKWRKCIELKADYTEK